MMKASKLKQLTSITADQMSELLLDSEHDTSGKAFINTHFDGMELDADFDIILGGNLNFIYQAQYADLQFDGGLKFDRVIVAYNFVTGCITADYAA
jgi:hypothetical protein